MLSRRSRDATIVLVLTEASAAASLAVLPFAADLAEPRRRVRDLALPTLLASHVVFGASSAAGLAAARRAGLEAPWLRRWARGGPLVRRGDRPLAFVGVGALAAAGVTVLDATAFQPPDDQEQPAAWKRLLAVPYGAINEEIQARLVLLSLAALGFQRATGAPARSARVMAPSIALTSALFGVAHLPAAAQRSALTPRTVVRTVTLNSLLGAVFGTCFWRRGLESAMLAHAGAGVAVTVAGRVLPSGRLSD